MLRSIGRSHIVALSHGRRPPLQKQCLFSRSLASSSALQSYDDTISNLAIGPSTRVIYQGFSGKVATSNAVDSIKYGTNVVGGTTPGKRGQHLGLPLLPSVREAADQLKPDATAVFVAAHQAATAIEDAIAAEIPLVVAVAEFIPLHDILRICSILKTQSKTRFVGANSPGIISPLGNCRIGFQPLPCYLSGHVGLVAKSGTLSYETVGALTRAGLGQSLCIGMGGDIVAGTSFVDALRLFENDPNTRAIVLVGEVGGRAEQDAAEWIKSYKKRTADPKPVVALVAGLRAPPGRVMGHAGAFASLGEEPSSAKHKALENAGVTLVSHPSKIPAALRSLSQKAGRNPAMLTSQGAQKREYHTITTKSLQIQCWESNRLGSVRPQQRRCLYLGSDKAKELLKERGIPVSAKKRKEVDKRFLAFTVNRSDRCPAIIASPTAQEGKIYPRSRTFTYDYRSGPDEATSKAVFEHLHMDAAPPAAMATLGKIQKSLAELFKSKEAYALSIHISGTQDGNLQVERADFGFDDSAYKSSKRQEDIVALRDMTQEDADEVEGERDGIVYVKLDDPKARIGTLDNGAGLAMNTVDALDGLGAKPTNFLDTGGKATSATIKKSFELLLKDSRTKVIFVNIFGGLTLCDMIADGIMLAFKDLSMSVPVVVRLRGTNEEKGQKMISESGLPLHAFDDFDEAAKKCIELADGS